MKTFVVTQEIWSGIVEEPVVLKFSDPDIAWQYMALFAYSLCDEEEMRELIKKGHHRKAMEGHIDPQLHWLVITEDELPDSDHEINELLEDFNNTYH